MQMHRGASLERWTLAALLVVLGAFIAAVGAVAFGVPFGAALVVACLVGFFACSRIARRLPPEWDGMRHTHRAWSIAFLLIALVALGRMAGVAWFIADARHAQTAVYSFDHFYTAHSCYSGYWRAAEMVRAGVANLYDTAHYAGHIGRFEVDEFLYLPQFLILPRLGLALGGGFYTVRAAWFALEAALLALATIELCRWIGGGTGRRAALLLAALWLSTPVLATLQIGNFQVAAIAVTVLAMVMFERNRPVLGGALLAIAAVKLFPALLCVYLVAAKRWRAVAWTIAFSLLYCAAAYAWFGAQPFAAFLHYDLPRLVSGQAWSFVEDPDVSAINDSVPGLVLKLKSIGVAGMGHPLEAAAGWIWTIFIVILAVLAGRRSWRLSRLERACCWLSLFTFAAFRARFMPDMYGLVAPVLLWTLIAAFTQWTWRNRIWLFLTWLALNAVVPFGGTPLTVNGRLLISTASQFFAIGVCLFVFLKYVRRRAPSEASAGVLTNEAFEMAAGK